MSAKTLSQLSISKGARVPIWNCGAAPGIGLKAASLLVSRLSAALATEENRFIAPACGPAGAQLTSNNSPKRLEFHRLGHLVPSVWVRRRILQGRLLELPSMPFLRCRQCWLVRFDRDADS
jgi:hypothetical protein